MTTSFVLALSRLPALQKRLTQLNRRATRLGLPETVLTLKPETKREIQLRGTDGLMSVYGAVDAEISSHVVKAEGWALLAKLDHLQDDDGKPVTDVHLSPETVPTLGLFQDLVPHCDHCNTNRLRKCTFVLAHTDTGAVKQVGRSCLTEFIKTRSGEKLLEQLDHMFQARHFIDECTHLGHGALALAVDRRLMLTAAASALRQYGWVSATEARESYCKEPTSAMTRQVLHDLRATDSAVATAATTPEDGAAAEETELWLEELARRVEAGTEPSEFHAEMASTLSQQYLSIRRVGLATYAVHACQREKATKAQLARFANSAHQGIIGKRQQFSLEALDCRSMGNNEFGECGLYRFTDTCGNLYSWFTQFFHGFEAGKKYSAKATVKAHVAVRGLPVTQLTRVKLSEI